MTARHVVPIRSTLYINNLSLFYITGVRRILLLVVDEASVRLVGRSVSAAIETLRPHFQIPVRLLMGPTVSWSCW